MNALLSTISMSNAIYNKEQFICINKEQEGKERETKADKILQTNTYYTYLTLPYDTNRVYKTYFLNKNIWITELFFVKCLRCREHYYHPMHDCSIRFKIHIFKLLFYISCWFYSLFARLYKIWCLLLTIA